MRGQPGCVSLLVPVLHGLRSHRPPQSPYWCVFAPSFSQHTRCLDDVTPGLTSTSTTSAIMSYNFHQVKTHEQSELFKLRARIILDIETFMSDEERSDDQLFPSFFQILQRKTSKTTEDIVKSVRALAWGIIFSLVAECKQDVYSRLDAQMAAVEELCAKTQCAFAAKDAALAEMSRTLQLLLERSASVN